MLGRDVSEVLHETMHLIGPCGAESGAKTPTGGSPVRHLIRDAPGLPPKIQFGHGYLLMYPSRRRMLQYRKIRPATRPKAAAQANFFGAP